MGLHDRAEGVGTAAHGRATADELYASVERMLEEGLHEAEDFERAQALLGAARQSSTDPDLRRRIDILAKDMAERYGADDDDQPV